MLRRPLMNALVALCVALCHAALAQAQHDSHYHSDGCAQTGLVGMFKATGLLGTRSDCCCLKDEPGHEGCLGHWLDHGEHKGGAKSCGCKTCSHKAPPHVKTCWGHDCCHCGCAQADYCNWCGHGKYPGEGSHLTNGFLPKCDRYRRYADYCNGAWYGGYWGGPGGGYWGGPGGGYYLGGGYDAGFQPDLFYNYYAPQTAEGGVPTDMYAAPHDTPYPAIQVYYTYQPWLPHEFLYNHHRQYWRWHNGGYGATQTCVTWGGSPTRRVAEQGFSHPVGY